MTTVWVDAGAGASGDMLLGALAGAGVPVEVMQQAVDAVAPEPVTLRTEAVHRGALAATRCHVETADSVHRRTWPEIRALITAADLDAEVATLAEGTFARLAEAEARVHGIEVDRVHFHEVGALDAIADIVGVCAGFARLRTDRVVVSPIAVGSGRVETEHGSLPVPVPAVTELLRGALPSYGGPATAPPAELCTPTGAALLRVLATDSGPQPTMRTERVGVGAGGRDPAGHANVVRLLVGGSTGSGAAAPGFDTLSELVVETNVDDLDPRVWPAVLEALLAAGAVDAWLTPITMKKGRPAHTLAVLTPFEAADRVRATVVAQTSSIGFREYPVTKRALPRTVREVTVDGHPVAVKLSRFGQEMLTAQPEWDDVARAAKALGRPPRDVLAAAVAAAHHLT